MSVRSDARKRMEEEFRGDRLIVGLIGKKRSGKDTFAAPLVEQRGFRRLSFADNLRQAALGLDPLIRFEADETYLYAGNPLEALAGRGLERLSSVVDRLGWEAAKEIREVRRTLQRFGTDAIREIDSGFWVRGVTSKMQGPGSYVVTDVRFPNEAEAIHALGGTIVRVVRPGLVSDDSHSSETALDGYPADLEVINAGTAESLAETALHLLF